MAPLGDPRSSSWFVARASDPSRRSATHRGASALERDTEDSRARSDRAACLARRSLRRRRAGLRGQRAARERPGQRRARCGGVSLERSTGAAAGRARRQPERRQDDALQPPHRRERPRRKLSGRDGRAPQRKARAPARDGRAESAELVDVPGAYSLSARSAEEQIALNSILGLSGHPTPALTVRRRRRRAARPESVLHALQLAELSVPLIVALNMIDEVSDNPPDPRRSAACSASRAWRRTGATARGSPELERSDRARALGAASRRGQRRLLPRARGAPRIAQPKACRASSAVAVERNRALALWALTSIEEDDELGGSRTSSGSAALEIRRRSRGPRHRPRDHRRALRLHRPRSCRASSNAPILTRRNAS